MPDQFKVIRQLIYFGGGWILHTHANLAPKLLLVCTDEYLVYECIYTGMRMDKVSVFHSTSELQWNKNKWRLKDSKLQRWITNGMQV